MTMTAGPNLAHEAGSDATALVILGASGNLAHQKLGPAIFNLFRKGRLPDNLHVVGVARNTMTDDEFRNWLHESSAGDATKAEWDDFAARLCYVAADITDRRFIGRSRP